jgi:hypothetical protein
LKKSRHHSFWTRPPLLTSLIAKLPSVFSAVR